MSDGRFRTRLAGVAAVRRREVVVSLPSGIASEAAPAFELLLAPLDLGESVKVPQVLFLLSEHRPPLGVIGRRDPRLLEHVRRNVDTVAEREGLEQMHRAFVGMVVAGHGVLPFSAQWRLS